MFKKGDIVVRVNRNGTAKTEEKGFIFRCLIEDGRAYYNTRSIHPDNCRKATDNEIKWFEAGITNINQIPKIKGTFENDYKIKCTINIISNSHIEYVTYNTGSGRMPYKTFIEYYSKSYKPPVKSQNPCVEIELPEEPFKIEDLKNSKIGNLTPEDHKIIQPWLFSLGYEWTSSKHSIETRLHYKSICITINSENKSCRLFSDSSNVTHTIKKETILNYIKQLNTNKNEVHRQNQEISRGPINGSARILSGRQQGSTGSRPKGNVTCLKGRETYIRSSKVRGSVRLG